MKLTITEPTKAYITEATSEEIQQLKKQLSYTNTSIRFQLNELEQMFWFKKKDPIGFNKKLIELTQQVVGSTLNKDKNGIYIRPGSIPYLKKLKFTVENNIVYPELTPIPWVIFPEFEPYAYQHKSRDELLKILHGNISLATGTGKSFILQLLTQIIGLRIVIVTPSKSIFNELLKKFQISFGEKLVGGYGDGKKCIKKKITIAIGKSLTMLEPDTAAYRFFQQKQVLMVDESHTFAANLLETVCHGVLANAVYRFFVSATQTRGDGTKKMLQSIIGKTVVKKNLKEAITEGYLCPLKFTVLRTFSPSTKTKKDPIECKREHFLRNPKIAQLAAKIANASWNVKQHNTLILVEELQQIQMLIKLITVPFSYVHSGSLQEAKKWGLNKIKDQQNEIDKFNEGKVNVLIGTKAIAMGTNMYPTHNTINWLGGSSEVLTKQGPMGRSTRILEISEYKDLHQPKPYCMIYDFRVLGQKILDKQLIKRAKYYRETGEKMNYF
jgi:superfamily II DNA or RNA helicase